MSAEAPSILELARNRARNSRATQAEKPRNKRPESDPDLLRVVAQPARVVELVTCATCKHFEPDPVNPPAGLGACAVNATGGRLPWPNLPRRCGRFEITRAAVFKSCKAACKGLQVDPSELCQWLIGQKTTEWLHPAAVQRWAELIEQRGYPDD